jgi:hypothetical protein
MKRTIEVIGKQLVILILAAGLATVVGCGATKPASASFASVVIDGHTVNEVRNAAGEVFTADGYTAMVRGNEMRFEKEGSRAKQLAYEGFADPGPVKIRVDARIVQLSESSIRFECNAYIVKSPGDPTFEEVIKVQNIRSGPYRDLVNKVAAKLK